MMNKLFKNRRIPASVLSLVLVISILISTFSGLAIFADNTGGEEDWDGTAATSFAKGVGTKENPYIVSTPAELMLAVSSTGMDGDNQLYYKMVNDIYVNDVSDPLWMSGSELNEWLVVSTAAVGAESAFGGVFNGNGYKVFGIYVSEEYTAQGNTADKSVATGLFPSIAGSAKISAVGVENSYFALTNDHSDANKAYVGYVGIIAGYVYNTTATDPIAIDRCYAHSDVSIKSVYAGLVAGVNSRIDNSLVVTNCYSVASATVSNAVSNSNRITMVSGGNNAKSAKMDYNFALGGMNWSGGSSDNLSNYSTEWIPDTLGKNLGAAKMQGAAAFNSGNMEKLNGQGAYMLTDSYPELRVFARTESGEKLWDGSFTVPAIGSGTENAPYIINEPAELAYVIKYGSSTGMYYRLESDIYLNDISKINWQTGEVKAGYTANSWLKSTDATPFKGTLDGNGHIVYGLYYDQSGDKAYNSLKSGVGLIPAVTSEIATVKDLGIDCAYLNFPNIVGAFVAFNKQGTVNIEQSFVGEDVYISGYDCGAFIGATDSSFTLKSCYSLASFDTDNAKHYGFIGDAYSGGKNGKVEYSYNAKGPVSSKTDLNNVATNTYATVSGNGATLISVDKMQGTDSLTAEDKMINLGSAFIPTATYPMLSVFVGESDKYWDGETTTAPVIGDGTAQLPFEIDDAATLAYVIKNGGQGLFYKLTADIYLNYEDNVNWTTGVPVSGYTPNSWFKSTEVMPFSGTLDGDGHTVYGLYCDQSGDKVYSSLKSGVGLIPAVNSGTVTVKNLGIDCAYLNFPNIVGAFVGYDKQGTINIEQSFVGEDVYISGYDCGAFIGATDSSFTLKSCYSLADFDTANAKHYGFIGDAYSGGKNGKVEYSYNAKGPISSKTDLKGIATNTYATVSGNGATLISADKMQGTDALSADDKMKALGVVGTYKATDSYPTLKVFAGEAEENTVWDGAAAAFIAEGRGTATEPYVIKTAGELAFMLTSGGNGAFYKLGADIYLNDVSAENWYESANNNSWYGNMTFTGTLDGDGHIVYGIWYPTGNTYTTAGLIPILSGGTVKNIGVRYSYIKSTRYVGGIAGKIAEGTVNHFEQCFVDDTVEIGYTGAKTEGAGGILGYACDKAPFEGLAELTNCYSKAVITGTDAKRTNGLIGTVWTCPVKITDCYSVNSRPYVMSGHGTVSALYWDYNSDPKYTSGAQGLTDIKNILSGIYTDVSGNSSAIEQISLLDAASMRGEAAKTAMSAFDFTDVWQAVEGGTPKLKIFSSINGKDIITDSGDDSPVVSDYAGGTGIESDPYLIATAAQLKKAVTTTDGYFFKLTNDIYINDVSDTRWFENDNNTEWVKDTRFIGTLDGDGHCVNGIWYPKDNTYTVTGLVPIFAGGVIKNIGVRHSYVHAAKYAGALVGRTIAGAYKELSGSFSDETVYVSYTASGNNGAGGLIGFVNQDNVANEVRMLIKNCYSKANITGLNSERTNGLIGTVWCSAVKIVNSYSAGIKPYYMRKSGTISTLYWNYADGDFVSDAQGLTDINNVISGVYADTGSSAAVENYETLDATDLRKAENQTSLMKGFDFKSVWQAVEGGTPKLKIFTSIDGTDIPVVSEVYKSGTGTKEDPYIIKTVEELRILVESTSTKNKYYKLANDLFINDTTSSSWTLNSPEKWYNLASGKGATFEGTFDGDGHFIYGIYVNETPAEGSKMISNGAGLFPRISMDATVMNVHVRDSYISGVGYVGAIVGYMYGSSTTLYGRIIGCSADSTVTLKGQTVGGILGGGQSGAELQYVYFTGKLTATASGRGNGLVGDVWSPRQRVAQAYSVGYTNYRAGYIPNVAVALYGTVSQSKTTEVATSNMYGSKAKTAMPLLDWSVWSAESGKTPHMKVITDNMLYSFIDEGVKGRIWSGKLATGFAGGSGTESDPYIIETPEQMAYFVNNLDSTQGNFYKLTADLKMNDTSKTGWEKTAKEWFTSSSYFAGTFDGCGHVVSGLYYNSDDSIVALIPRVARGSVIKRVGLTQSTLTSMKEGDKNVGYVGSIAGYMANDEGDNYPIISQCFGDDTVILTGSSVGGIVAGGHQAARIDNCYFTGVINATSHGGTFVGNTWDGIGSIITNSYSISREFNPVGSNKSAKNFKCEGAYHEGPNGTVKTIKLMPMTYMKGEKAKENMPEFDYVTIWKTVEGGTPVLRCFKNAEKYTALRPGTKIEISFATDGGDAVASIFGYAGEPIGELPVPTYYAHSFKGWYVNKYRVIPFELDTFPTQNMVLYAKWEEFGFKNGFEEQLDEAYDYNEGVELFRPGVIGYSPRLIHGGMRSIRTISEAQIDPIFLTNYSFPLEVGKKYEVSFWVYVREDMQGSIDLLHGLHPDYYSDIVGYTPEYDLSQLKPNTWTQVTTTITANAPYLLVRTTKGAEVYYDDFLIVPLFEDGKLGELEGFAPGSVAGEPIFGMPLGWFVVAVGGVVVLLGGVVTVVVIILKRTRKQGSKSVK